MDEPNSDPVDIEGLFEIMTEPKSKSQARRINEQTRQELNDMLTSRAGVDVDLLQGELALANGHIEYLRGKLQELQTEVERLTRFEVQHLIRYGQGTFIPNEQLGDSK